MGADLEWIDEDAIRPAEQKALKIGLAHRWWRSAEIIHSIASTSKAGAGDLAVALSRVQRVEIGEAVNTEHDGLATDEELPDPVLQRGLSNPVKRLPVSN